MSARPFQSEDRAVLLWQLNRASATAYIERKIAEIKQERLAAAVELARAVDVARTLEWCERATGRRWANDQDHVRVRLAVDAWQGQRLIRRAGAGHR